VNLAMTMTAAPAQPGSVTTSTRAPARRRTDRSQLQHTPATNWLRDVILGGQDGLVNILGIVLGVIAAGGSNTILLATGFAAAITESISMGAVGYTSTIADRDHYQAVRRRERAEIDAQPDAERDALRTVYAAKGFSGQLLEQVVDTLTANRDRWLSTVLDDVLHLQPVATHDAVRSSVVVTGATLLGHLIPLVPFLVLTRTPAVLVAIGVSALVLFGVGAYSAITLVGDWRRSGLKMLAIGLGAAAIGFAIARAFPSGA
jgi:predicted membrane protein (TIGR00267 family)